MIIGVLLFLLIMAINKFEKLAEIGFLIFVLGVFVALIGVVLYWWGVINAVN